MPECIIYSDLSSSLTLIGNIKAIPSLTNNKDILKEQNKKKMNINSIKRHCKVHKSDSLGI